jgi:hypothetical protein
MTIEMLEDRRLLAFATISGGVLIVNGADRIFGGPEASDTIFGGDGNNQAADDAKDTYDSVETLLS